MSRAFVTGATGFIGRNLVRELRAAGWEVHALHRSDKGLDSLRGFGAIPVRGGIDDAGALGALIPDATDALFHVAASTSLWRENDAAQYQTNVVGTRNVVAAALARGVGRMIHTSSVAAWGDNAYRGVLRETTPSNAAGHWMGYCRSKWQAEQAVEDGIARGLDAVFINPANVVGPWDDHNWSSLIRLLAAGELPGVPPGVYSFCHVDEVARAHIAAFARGRRAQRYLIGGVQASYAEFIGLAAERLGVKPPRTVPGWALRGLAQVQQLISHFSKREPSITPEAALLVCSRAEVDWSLARRELGVAARPLAELVDDTLQWMRGSGQLD